MRQIFLKTPGEFGERHVPMAVAKEGEALVRIEKVGICGSDFHAFKGKHFAYTYPRVIGHEVSCTIVEVPENDRGLKAGDQCAIEPYVFCGHCSACAAGLTNCCENFQIFGIHFDGGMQGYVSMPLHMLHKSDALSLDQLALVETLGIGAHAVARSGLREGEQALVVGAGPIGVAVAQFAEVAGATVTVVEKNARRRALVEDMGLRCVESSESWSDAVFDATGNAQAMAASVHQVAIGGRLIYVGLTLDPLLLDDTTFHRREMTVLASRNSRNQFPRIIRLIEEGRIDTSPWITHRLTLSEVAARFESLPASDGLLKAMVDMEESDR